MGEAGSADVLDECRYTVVRVERQRLKVWDGAFLEEEARPCFERSLCFAGVEGTRVYAVAPDRVAVEVGARRVERPTPRGPHEAAGPSLRYALAGRDAVALLDGKAREVEVLRAEGDERFPLPALEPGEDVGAVVTVGDGVGLTLVAQSRNGPPVRPFVWLREPSERRRAGLDAQGARPLLDEDALVGSLARTDAGWRVSLVRGFSAVVYGPTPVAPRTFVGEAELVVVHERDVRVFDYGGATSQLTLTDVDVLFRLDDRVYRVAPGGGLARLSAAGFEGILPQAPGHDLAGAPLPKGAVIERVQVAPDDERRVAVVERVRSPGCRVRDRLHLVDVEARTVTTLAKDDAVRMHPAFARGRLHFVEADASYDVVGAL